MEKLLFLGIDSTTEDAFQYAKSKGIYTVVADYLDVGSSHIKAEANRFWQVDVKDLDTLEQLCREENITGIYAGSHELCLDSCKSLCERLGLPFYASEKGWQAARDKEIYKEYCLKEGLDIPKKYWIGGYPPAEALNNICFPVIVKPIDGSAKRGYSKVTGIEELWPAIEHALGFSERKRIIVEDYIEGNATTVTCVIHQDRLTLVDVLIDLSTINNGKENFCFGIHNSQYIQDIIKNLMPAYQRLVRDLECKEGTIFFQSMLRDGKYYQLEIGYRLDGICSWRHIEKHSGVNQLKYMVDLAMGKVGDEHLRRTDAVDQTDINIAYVISGRPGLIKTIAGKAELLRRSDVVVQLDRFQPGDTIPDTDDMTSIALIIEVFGKNHTEIAGKIKEINQMIHYYDAEGNDLLVHHDNLEEKWQAIMQLREG